MTNKSITQKEFDSLTFRYLTTSQYYHVFECLENGVFNIEAFKGDGGEHSWVRFVDNRASVLANEASKYEGFVLIDNPDLLNIDAAPEVLLDHLDWPDVA